MKNLFSLKKYEYILILTSLTISISLIVFSLNKIKDDNIEKIETSLITVNTSCHEALTQWLNFRKNSIQELSKNKLIIDHTLELLKLEQDSAILVSSYHTTELREFFQPVLQANEDLGVFLIAPNNISIFSMRDANTGMLNLMAKQRKELLDQVLVEGKTMLIPPIESDVILQSNYSNDTKHTMFIVTPIIHENKIIAAFSLRMDTHKDFSRILELGRIGETGETYAFDKSNKMVSTSRFENELKEMMKLKSTDRSIAVLDVPDIEKTTFKSNNKDSILSNNLSLTEMIDCRGQHVLGVRKWDKELNIGIITKIDKTEALNDFLFLRKVLYITFFLIIIIGIFAINIILNLRQKTEDILTEANEKLEAQVAERTKELQQTIKTKDKFFSILAHDLRSPFTGLLGLFEAILQNPEVITEEEKDSMMLETYNSSSQLFKLLENLLNWSRTQTKNIDLNPQEIAIKELIDDIINLQQQTAKNKNIELLNEIEQNLNVFADINTLDTVFRNLISNAIKFTREGGKIKIKAFVNNKTVKISVQDNGVGIPEEKLHKLFNIEEKTSTTGTNEESGTGLGLVLCKEFVELNNGNIFVESDIDQGSIFTVELPHNG